MLDNFETLGSVSDPFFTNIPVAKLHSLHSNSRQQYR